MLDMMLLLFLCCVPAGASGIFACGHNAMDSWCLSGSSVSSSVSSAYSTKGVMLSCFGHFGLAFAVRSLCPATWRSLGGISEHAGTDTHIVPSFAYAADLPWLLHGQVNGENLFCLAWSGFPCVARKRGENVCLPPPQHCLGRPHCVEGPWELVTPALPWQEHRLSRPSPPDQGVTDK